MVDGEFLELGIGLCALVKAVDVPRIVAGPDAGAADIQGHFAGSEELVHDLFAGRIWHLAQDIAGRIGESAAESENLLPCRARSEGDRVGRNLGCGLPRQRFALRITPVAKGGPDSHRSGRASGVCPSRNAR